jgi:hypothetical protein
MAEQPHDYAVVIGLNDYPTFGARGRPLAGAIEDAGRVARWLTDKEVGGGLPDANCRLIQSTPEPLSPTREVIDFALGSIFSRAEAGGGRRFYLYFSGHGQAKSPLDTALCLSHWSVMFRHAALSSERYQEMLLRCSPFQEVVLLLDCCRIRSVDAAGGSSEIGCAVPVGGAGVKRFMVGYATEFQNAAMEAEATGGVGVDEEGPIVRGHFTEALLAALYGGAARPEGGVPADKLKEYLEVNVARIASDHGHTQNAHVLSDFPEEAQPVFGSAQPRANFHIEFSPERSGPILLEAPDLEPVREDDASTGPWDLVLEKGTHRLEERRTGQEKYVPFVPSEETTNVTF